jgi:hypothetical protein
MNTPNNDYRESREQVGVHHYYGPVAVDKQTRITINTAEKKIVIETVTVGDNPQRVAGGGSVTLPLDGTYGTDIEPLETPMCDPETGAQGFSMVVRSPVYPVRKTQGPIQ